MIPIDKIQRGAAAYISAELEPQLDGFKKWAFAIVSSELIGAIPMVAAKAKDNKMIALTGIVGADGSVDVERLYKRVRPAAEKSPATIEIPIIGGITFNAQDVDALYNHIMRS